MIELIDLSEAPARPEAIDDLQALLQPLVGQPFLAFRVSYGDELRIHLGASRPARRRPAVVNGAYVVGLRASSWSIRSAPRSILLAYHAGEASGRARPQPDIRVVESDPLVAPGATVRAAMAVPVGEGFGLWLTMTDGSEVIVSPPPSRSDRPGDAGPPLADWEVLMADGRLLAVGPGRFWTYPAPAASP